MSPIPALSPTRADRPDLEGLTAERDVLRRLLATTSRALLVWDHALRLVWTSPAAQRRMASGFPKARLAALVRAGAAERRSVVARTSQMLLELDVLPANEGRCWVVVELKERGDVHERLSTLSRSERRVLELLRRGLSNREIAAELFISQHTVKTHVSHVLQKLDVSSRSKAGTLARSARPDSD